MTENEIATVLVDIFYRIHTTLGPGLFESVYEEVICYELELLETQYERQPEIPLIYKGHRLPAGFRADLIVENKVIVEIKSVEDLAAVHYKQLQTYLKLTGLKLGLLVNFNSNLIRDGIHRIANKL